MKIVLNFFKSFALSVISSLLVSVFVFLIGYSLVTGEFPPNLEKIKLAFQQIHGMYESSQKALAEFEKLRNARLQKETLPPEEVEPTQPPQMQSFEKKENLEHLAEKINQIEISLNHLRSQVDRMEELQKAAQGPQPTVRR